MLLIDGLARSPPQSGATVPSGLDIWSRCIPAVANDDEHHAKGASPIRDAHHMY